MNGQFVISLDFEKFWGIFDSKSLESYEQNLNAVDAIVDRLITLSDKYNVKLTFATVGFLFHDSKKALLEHIPNIKPEYKNPKHSPYSLIDEVPDTAGSNSVYFALDSIKNIRDNGNHEIGTHTYCHYYCLEEDQTLSQFEADIKMAVKAGNDLGIPIKSIVFPRNQINVSYLDICKTHGIIAYRGYENHTIYEPRPYKESKKTLHRIMRIIDAYFNITGNHIYELSQLADDNIVNIPSSYFLRPYSAKFGFREPFKLRRVKNGMAQAAKERKLYHLWFHPHNFGNNIDENFKNFESILKTYKMLQSKYNFESSTMSSLAEKISAQ
ncbi:polysaccharide deacetylase family protein [Winogradskyella sp. 3972H.M.0a.05]|uniref:polysaccharide deacetylase family protein n=1 Tax=Winogradskyella sp. 3972H.M.0a.05 TaxID=2950277 RepID=UPI0033995359